MTAPQGAPREAGREITALLRDEEAMLPFASPVDLLESAAQEIERLRAEIAHLFTIAHSIADCACEFCTRRRAALPPHPTPEDPTNAQN